MNIPGPDERKEMISVAAYYRAQRRGFENGDPVSDWLAAESEIDQRLGNEPDLRQRLARQLEAANERLKSLRQAATELGKKTRHEVEEEIVELARVRDRFRKRVKDALEQGAEVTEKTAAQAEKLWTEIVEKAEGLAARIHSSRKH
jgi:hypothetical protein